MSDPFRNLRLYWHRFRGTQSLLLAGVRLATGAQVPKLVRSLIFKRVYERAEQELLGKAVRAGDCVLEIGAGIGFIGLLAAKLAGPSGRVISYEANAELEALIRANYTLNSAHPDLRMRAVTVDGAPVAFHVNQSLLSSSLYAREETAQDHVVESDAIDAVLAELSPNVLVMDVEGAEIDLLGASDLSGLRVIVLEIHPHIVGEKPIADLVDHLKTLGFDAAEQRENTVLFTR